MLGMAELRLNSLTCIFEFEVDDEDDTDLNDDFYLLFILLTLPINALSRLVVPSTDEEYYLRTCGKSGVLLLLFSLDIFS